MSRQCRQVTLLLIPTRSTATGADATCYVNEQAAAAIDAIADALPFDAEIETIREQASRNGVS